MVTIPPVLISVSLLFSALCCIVTAWMAGRILWSHSRTLSLVVVLAMVDLALRVLGYGGGLLH